MKQITILLALFLLVNNLWSQTDSLTSHVYILSELPVQKDSSRGRIQIMDGKTPYMSNFEVHLTILEPGKAAHPPHTHTNTEELLIVREGKLKVTIAGKTKILEAGGVAISMPGDEHGAVNAGNTQCSYYVLKYTKDMKPDLQRANQSGGSILVDWPETPVQKTDKGERRQQFDRPTSLFGKFDFHTTQLNKGEVSHPQHTHEQEEIIIVRKGTVEMHIADKFYKAGPGDVIFLATKIPHALRNTYDGACEYFAFQWL